MVLGSFGESEGFFAVVFFIASAFSLSLLGVFSGVLAGFFSVESSFELSVVSVDLDCFILDLLLVFEDILFTILRYLIQACSTGLRGALWLLMTLRMWRSSGVASETSSWHSA